MAAAKDKMRLTRAAIERLRHNGSARHIVWDSEALGLGVRLYPSGAKAFVCRYPSSGRERMIVLGSVYALSIADARAHASRIRLDAREGRDVLTERNTARIETLSDLIPVWLEHYSKAKKKSWRRDELRLNRHIVPTLGTKTLSEISPLDCLALHKKLSAAGKLHEANRVIELLSTIFATAERWGIYDGKNPAKAVTHNRETSRERYVSPEELRALSAALDAEPNIYARSAVWLFILTGLRKNELLAAKWEDLDRGARTLTIPETKNGQRHTLPLSDAALKIINELPRQHRNPYLFPGAKAGAHLVNPDKAWRRIKAAAGLSDLRLHDLRRTLGSWLAQRGEHPYLVGKILNQKSERATAIYSRFDKTEERRALELMSAAIDDALKR